jgi:hypothetical protein
MKAESRSSSRFPCLTPLAACFAAIFALSAPAAIANTIVVTDCNDNGGGGSLRAAVASAASGDTIDMTALTCSTISLTNGAIAISQNNLTLDGPGIDNLVISGYYLNGRDAPNDRVIDHAGTGTLRAYNLSISDGNLYETVGPARGGCVYSGGSVELGHVRVSHCQAEGTDTNNEVAGGGIFTWGGLTAKYSMIEANRAYAHGTTAIRVHGGGAAVRGDLVTQYSTIDGNVVFDSGTPFADDSGGGLYLTGNAFIVGSTVSGNQAEEAGGIFIIQRNTPIAATIIDSTISGNHALDEVGGLLAVNVGSGVSSITLRNSTVAFNTAVARNWGSGVGVVAGTNTASSSITLESSLLSNNAYTGGGPDSDFAAYAGNGGAFTIAGANNLIRVTANAVPPDTITGACPDLGPLRDNGGPTKTHALLSRSPAIDRGNNANTLSYDQRGVPYARVSGPAADIGAYEVQQGDIIFNNGFDGC